MNKILKNTSVGLVTIITALSVASCGGVDKNFETVDKPTISVPSESNKNDNTISHSLVINVLGDKITLNSSLIGNEVDLNNYIPEIEGKIFVGWYADKNFTIQLKNNSISLADNDLEIYAKMIDDQSLNYKEFMTSKDKMSTHIVLGENEVIELTITGSDKYGHGLKSGFINEKGLLMNSGIRDEKKFISFEDKKIYTLNSNSRVDISSEYESIDDYYLKGELTPLKLIKLSFVELAYMDSLDYGYPSKRELSLLKMSDFFEDGNLKVKETSSSNYHEYNFDYEYGYINKNNNNLDSRHIEKGRYKIYNNGKFELEFSLDGNIYLFSKIKSKEAYTNINNAIKKIDEAFKSNY